MESWETKLRRVTPYVPGEQPKDDRVIKLNTNENPYPPTPRVAQVLSDFDVDGLRKYPDPAAEDLTSVIAETYGVDKNRIFVGVGSDDVLAMSFLTFFCSRDPILFPDITYSFYDVWADLFRIPYKSIPIDDAFAIRTEDYLSAAPCGGIILPNPNAPTGRLKDPAEIERIVAAHPECVVIIDEAYIDFAPEGSSVLPLIDQFDNLLVVRTFSKSRSLAGSRIGYAFGSQKLISALSDVKYSFNSYTMDRLTIAIGRAAMEDEAYFKKQTERIIATREYTAQRLLQLGFSFPKSSANFLFITHPDIPAAQLFSDLKENRIFVRYFKRPRIDDYLRVTIGTREEMDAFLSFLQTKYHL